MKLTGVSRRGFLKAAAGVAAWMSGGATRAIAAEAGRAGGAAAVGAKRPNIVVILADDLGYECIGADGGTSYKTPVLDKLAAEGVRFEHGYAQPLCTPTRAQIMTGIYNVRNYVRFGLLDPKQTTFANLLRKAGYATCVAGKWQLLGGYEGPGGFGFDEYCLWQLNRVPSRYASPGLEVGGKQMDCPGKYGPDVVSDFLCDFMRRNRNKPFCLYYPMILTHCPFEPTPDSADWAAKSVGSKTYKGDAKYFGEMVTYMDKVVGKLLATLDEIGVRDNTLVIFMGDNGTDKPVVSKMTGGRSVAGGKGATTDAGTHVPLIASWPAGGGRGKVCNDLVDSADILPTICQCAGVTVPAELAIDGQSFLPQIRGEKGEPREWTYCWYSRDGNPANAKEYARNQRYKLYRDGRYFDIPADEPEKSPLAESSLTDDARKARAMLQGVLDKYANAWPAKLKGGNAAKAKDNAAPKAGKKGKKAKQ